MEKKNSASIITVKDTIDAQKKSIDEAHEAFIQEVKATSTDLAVQGLPELRAGSIEHYVEFIRATYSRMLNDSSLSLSGSVRNEIAALDIFSLRSKIKELKLKGNTLSNQLDGLKATRKKFIGQGTAKEFEKMKLTLNIFTVIECLGYIGSFVSLGDNYGLALVWGLLLGVGQTTGIKSLSLWMRDGSGAALSSTTKRIVWGAVAFVATGLGLLRYASMQTGDAGGLAKSVLAPFIFILISYFLISVLALYVWHNYPNTEHQSNLKKASGLDEEITALEKELKECRDQVASLTDDCNTVAQVHTLLIHASKDFFHRVNNHFLYAVGIFKSTNRISRTDNISPDCFSLPITPLEMPKYDAWDDDSELDTANVTENA